MTRVDRRGVVVMGAASGIGRAVGERLAGGGFGVLVVDLERAGDAPGEPFAAGLTTRAGNRGAVDAALERLGRLDAVVPDAGLRHVAAVAEFAEDRWDALLAVLFRSSFLLAGYGWRALLRGGDGRSSSSPACAGLWPGRSRPATCRPCTG
jgi:NAD(P)-dependent dehydrogenase (short-subunit alcohol dehydrogenase family)